MPNTKLIELHESECATGERLFIEQTQCCRCNGFFDETKYSKILCATLCDDCWNIEEQEHKDSMDYDGDEFC